MNIAYQKTTQTDCQTMKHYPRFDSRRNDVYVNFMNPMNPIYSEWHGVISRSRAKSIQRAEGNPINH